MREGDFESYLRTHDFSSFYVATRPGWSKLARKVLRLIDHPADVDSDDVMQVMLIAAVRFMDEWDPAKGRSLKTFVVWRAIDKAEKYLHAKRGCQSGGNRSGFSKYEFAHDGLKRQTQHVFVGTIQDTESRALVHEMMGRAGVYREAVEEFLVTGDLQAAAEVLVSSGQRPTKTKKKALRLLKQKLGELVEMSK